MSTFPLSSLRPAAAQSIARAARCAGATRGFVRQGRRLLFVFASPRAATRFCRLFDEPGCSLFNLVACFAVRGCVVVVVPWFC